MRALLSAFVFASLLTGGCTEGNELDDDQGADLVDGIRDDDKADGATGIDVVARLRPGTLDTKLTTKSPRQGFIFFAGAGSKITLEVTRAGTKAGLDTMIKVYGPRLSDGSYPKTIAVDDDAGFGKLSRLADLAFPIPGFYLVEVTNGAAVTTPANDASVRLKLSCTAGACDSELPVVPLGNDIKWYQRAAERRALSLQAYALATQKLEEKAATLGSFAVVLDIDETTLDNSTIQRERAELGLGFSQPVWTKWIEKRAASPIPGALAFTRRVRELGGKVVFVTNRLAFECAATEDNLQAHGFEYDGILCKSGTSDKNPRFKAIVDGTTGIAGLPATPIAMWVGHNIQDFPQLTQDIRTQPDAAFGNFGDSFWLIPNPMYGSWEKNVD